MPALPLKRKSKNAGTVAAQAGLLCLSYLKDQLCQDMHQESPYMSR